MLLQVDRLASLWSASQAAVKSVNEDLAAKCQAVAGLEGELGKAREDLAAREGEVERHKGAIADLEVRVFKLFNSITFQLIVSPFSLYTFHIQAQVLNDLADGNG